MELDELARVRVDFSSPTDGIDDEVNLSSIKLRQRRKAGSELVYFKYQP